MELPTDGAHSSHGKPCISLGAPDEDRISIAASQKRLSPAEAVDFTEQPPVMVAAQSESDAELKARIPWATRGTGLEEMPVQMQSNTPQKQVGLNPAELNRNTQKSAAHLIGRADQSPSSGLLKWESKLGEAFTEGIKYINGGLQVNKTGLYFVYSRVEFFSLKCNPRDFYTHKVGLQRNNRNRTLMEDHQEGLCLAKTGQAWMTGSHLGSLQQLKESDWLFVNVSHPHLLSKNYHSNYFGLFKIH
ncbi:tumor necrosis factor ligand superfamily member 6 [Garra rufa]|uniref:tumor necrosis factor ligand superfamily member 6 n=1 Tax=Garra rufa TaxID=137080 RepID=UPI003CCE6368